MTKNIITEGLRWLLLGLASAVAFGPLFFVDFIPWEVTWAIICVATWCNMKHITQEQNKATITQEISKAIRSLSKRVIDN